MMNLNYKQKGQGEMIFLLQGWGTDIELYDSLIDVLSQKYCVVAPVLPGFGKTSEPNEPWGVGEYTDCVIEFIKSFNQTKIILFGHSFGGRIILKMFEKQTLPFVVDKIVITGGAGIKPKPKWCSKIVAMLKFLKVFLPPELLEKIKIKLGSEDYVNATPVMRKCMVKVVNEDLRHLLPNVVPETLLIWGENDIATPLIDGKEMERKMRNAGLVVIKNAGHYAFLEQPLLFVNILKSFLKIGE